MNKGTDRNRPLRAHRRRFLTLRVQRRNLSWRWAVVVAGPVLAIVVTVAICVVLTRRQGNTRIATAAPVPTRHDVRSSMSAAAEPTTVEVYKSPTCGCCVKWIEHLRAEGFAVRATDLDNLNELKASHGVPQQLQSCHTAVVNGYALEGHVPAADVRRLLQERPTIGGLAVAGMPIGSPGMEVPGTKAHAYDVIAFDKGGVTQVFASYGR